MAVELKESFEWAAPLAFYKEEGNARLYKGRAISARISGNKVKYTAAELKIAARSLASRPINLNHKIPLPFPANCVVDADFENNAVEDIIKISDEKVQKLIEDKKIQKQSIEGQAREGKPTTGGAQEAVGLHFTGLALVTNDETPGDPTTDIKLWETVLFYETTVDQLLAERPELAKATNEEGQTLGQVAQDAIIVARCAKCNEQFSPEETKCPHCGELFEIREVDLGEPYPNEHACRLKEPGAFEDKSFRRINQGKLNIIIGKLKGKSTTTAQAYRYPKDNWSADAARAHCEKAGGSFEAAQIAQTVTSQSPSSEVKDMSKESKETPKEVTTPEVVPKIPEVPQAQIQTVAQLNADTGQLVEGKKLPPDLWEELKRITKNSIDKAQQHDDKVNRIRDTLKGDIAGVAKEIVKTNEALKTVVTSASTKAETLDAINKLDIKLGGAITETKEHAQKRIEAIELDRQSTEVQVKSISETVKQFGEGLEGFKKKVDETLESILAGFKAFDTRIDGATKLAETVQEKLSDRKTLKAIPFKGTNPNAMQETVKPPEVKVEVDEGLMQSWAKKFKQQK